MANVELVIKIPKQVYNYIRKYEHIANIDILDIKDAIVDGTPLPKGHGRLIDADAFLKENKDYTEWILCSDAWGGDNACKDTLEDMINEAPTIIEADRRVKKNETKKAIKILCRRSRTADKRQQKDITRNKSK